MQGAPAARGRRGAPVAAATCGGGGSRWCCWGGLRKRTLPSSPAGHPLSPPSPSVHTAHQRASWPKDARRAPRRRALKPRARAAAVSGSIVLKYPTSWSPAFIHYKVEGGEVAPPGSCTDLASVYRPNHQRASWPRRKAAAKTAGREEAQGEGQAPPGGRGRPGRRLSRAVGAGLQALLRLPGHVARAPVRLAMDLSSSAQRRRISTCKVRALPLPLPSRPPPPASPCPG